MNIKRNISIIGGAGHVGFPLGLIFSSKGFRVSLIDIHTKNIEKINKGKDIFDRKIKCVLKLYLVFKTTIAI